MLVHRIVDIRSYQNKYLMNIEITEDETGKVYSRRLAPHTMPDEAEQLALVNKIKDEIQIELDYVDNAMNLSTDEERLLEHYRGIKRDIVLRIRQFPAATIQQASDYIAAQYSNSPVDFANLYGIWLEMIGISTWAEFKNWVINHKFREVDA